MKILYTKEMLEKFRNKIMPESQETTKNSCMCKIHLTAAPDRPCIGHGDMCPCTKLIEENKNSEV